MTICLKCGEESAFTIRGLCAKCAPKLHRLYRFSIRVMCVLDYMYREETGKTAAEDWNEFETFMMDVFTERPKIAKKMVAAQQTAAPDAPAERR